MEEPPTTTGPVYLDYAATTPTDPRVAEVVMHHLISEFGNAGSRTHEFGSRAAKAVEHAREQVAAVVDADVTETFFTSGATEADNLALLGLAEFGEQQGRTHIVASAIEHKAVLEPLDQLAKRGFEVDLVAPSESGAVDAAAILDRVRPDTLLVSVMQVNNETGVRQPIGEIAAGLDGSATYLHTDAAQGYGKDLEALRNSRIDLISISGHKLFAPKGVGALVARRRGRKRPPLEPLLFGGGQERGLRPGTVPVALVAGFGLAAELARLEAPQRWAQCSMRRAELLAAVLALGGLPNGDPDLAVPHILNFSLPGADSEAVILALRQVAAISNGSACTSAHYRPSHVLTAMGLDDDRRRGAVRMSWAHDVELPPTEALVTALSVFR